MHFTQSLFQSLLTSPTLSSWCCGSKDWLEEGERIYSWLSSDELRGDKRQKFLISLGSISSRRQRELELFEVKRFVSLAMMHARSWSMVIRFVQLMIDIHSLALSPFDTIQMTSAGKSSLNAPWSSYSIPSAWSWLGRPPAQFCTLWHELLMYTDIVQFFVNPRHWADAALNFSLLIFKHTYPANAFCIRIPRHYHIFY